MKKLLAITLLFGSAYGADSVVTVAPSGGDYTTVEAALDANEMDLTSVLGAGDRFVIQITGTWSTPDTDPITVDNYTADSDNYIYIYTDAGARHNGAWDTGAYIIAVNGNPLVSSVPFTKIEGIQVDHTYNGVNPRYGVYLDGTADTNTFSHSIVRTSAASTNTKYGIHILGADCDVYNNIVYDFIDNASDVGIFCNSGLGEVARVYNNTIVNCKYGIWDQSLNADAQNNLLQGCENRTTAVNFDAATDYNTTDSSSFEYTQATTEDSVDATITFSGASNFHLASQQHNNGVDLSAVFTDDIDGDTRSGWNRGADEFVAASGTKYVKVLK